MSSFTKTPEENCQRTSEQFEQLQNKIEQASELLNQKKGALKRVMAELQTVHGVGNLKEAKEHEKQLTESKEQLEKEHNKEIKLFLEKWDDVINKD